jgi:hypothetical protein
LIADLLADPLDGSLDDVYCRPVRQQATALVQEALEDVGAVRSVDDLGVELHREEPSLGVLHRGDRADLRVCGHSETLGGGGHRVAVAHPDDLSLRQIA